MGHDAVDALLRFLDMFRAPSPLPILWVGAGASAAAGHPTLWQLEEKLRGHLPGSKETGFALVDAFVNEWGSAALENLLETSLGAPRRPAGLHGSMARLAGVGSFAGVFTTNYDELIEDALKDAQVRYVPQVLEQNFRLQARAEVQVLKLHGSRTDWASVVLSGASYQRFHEDYPLLKNQLDLNLRTHPLLFVGCSMQDPRILEWLRGLPEKERSQLFSARVLITERDWGRIPEADRALLASANVKAIRVETYDDIGAVLAEAARLRAPLAVRELVFTIAAAGATWSTVGPTPEHAAHKAPSPLHDVGFLRQLAEFRDLAASAIVVGTPEGTARSAALEGMARAVGVRLTEALLSDAARADVVARLHAVDRGRAHLVVRVPGASEESDAALALPWELVLPDGSGDFPVRAGALDVMREAVMPGAPGLPEATGPLVLAVSIAAPEDASRLAYEDEAYRLQRALEALGHDVAFTDLGDVDDLVRVADGVSAGAIHFSGHGMPGVLVFENELGLAERVEIGELVRRLKVKLTDKAERFPRFFYLASCHGAAGSGEKVPECRADASADEKCAVERVRAVGRGPSTAATLHRSGFVQVLGYFGPISDALSTRAEVAFYGAVAMGKTTLQAAAEARESMGREIALGDVKASFPFAWTQLALYHRGSDRALARPGKAAAGGGTARLQRAEVMVSGMPVLKYGFIGRRATLHRIRRLDRDGQRLFVIQGLGGLGKTALATHLLATMMAPERADQVILACGGIDPKTMDAAGTLWRQVEEHAERHGVPGWADMAKALREELPESVVGFERAVETLRAARPGVVVYADNLETLQEGPAGDDTAALGSWSAAGKPVWEALERLSHGGRVLATTRYAWRGLDPKAWVPIEPMREADVLRMVDTWPVLGGLPRSVQARIAHAVDGHPRTVEFLERLVAERREDMGLGAVVGDAWAELVEPVLPTTTGKVTENLLLEKLWGRLSEGARAQARAMSVLRRPAPSVVVEALGSAGTTGELVRAGVVTLFKEQANDDKGLLEWVERWGMHSVVGAFAGARAGVEEKREAHRKAGVAFTDWVKGPNARWVEQAEGIAHLHAAGDGDLASAMVQEYALWLREKAQYREASALLVSSEAAGASGDRLATALVLMGQMMRRLGDHSDSARRSLERAVRLAESDGVRGSSIHELGALLWHQGKYREADALLRQALAIKEKEIGTDHPSYGTSLHDLAHLLEEQGNFDEAEVLFRQALTIDKKTLTVGHRSYGTALNSLAGVLGQQGKYAEAEALLRESLAIQKQALGIDHPEYGSVLNNLAGVLQQQGKHVEAEPLLRQSVALVEKALGVSHPSYSAALNNFAGALKQQGKFGEAEAMFRQSLAIQEKALGVEHPSLRYALTNLGVVLADQGRVVEAELPIQRALRIAEQTHGSGHPDTAQVGSILAQVQFRLAKPEAKHTAQRALATFLATLGPDHPTTKDVTPILRHIASGTSAAPQPAGLSAAIDAALQQAQSGDPSSALRDLEALANEASTADAPAAELSARIALAQVLAGTGQPFLAGIHLRAALTLAEGAGDEAGAAQVRAMLQALDADP